MEDSVDLYYDEVEEDRVSSKEPQIFRGGHSSVHSAGFTDFLLRPELLRAINDSGFEHPSEGIATPVNEIATRE